MANFSFLGENSAIHRGDYQRVLLETAAEVGANIITDADVTGIETASDGPQTLLIKDGRRISADVVIGADGKCTSDIQTVFFEQGNEGH